MKGKLLLIAIMLMGFATLSFGQLWQVTIFASMTEDLEDPCDFTYMCSGGDLIADGHMGVWIDNNTGEPAAVPPHSGNTFTFNGETDLGMPGNFYSFDLFGLPNWAAGASYHAEVPGAIVGGFQHVWVSPSWSPPANGAFEIYWPRSVWTCELRSVGVPCEPTPEVNFDVTVPYGPQDAGVCVTLCEGSTTPICVGPVPLPDRVPHVSVLPGCMYPPMGCEDECVPANVWTLTPFVMVQGADGYYFCANLMYAGEEGCVCVHLDFIEGVEAVDLDVAFDGAVRLNWSAASGEIANYVIARNGSDLATVASNVYSFVDENFDFGVNYTYELAALDLTGNRTVLATASVTPSEGAITVTEYAMHQNYPNPFNPSTTIRFDLVETNFVTLKVFNATGQEVATLVNGSRAAGVNYVNFDATNLTSGLYFYSVQIGDVYSATKKMLLVK